MTKRIIKKIVIVCTVLIFLTGVIYCIADWNRCIFHKFGAYNSPNNSYSIVIKRNGPMWPFGSEDIRIYAKENTFLGNLKSEKYYTSIENDGKSLDENNIVVIWQDNEHAKIVLSGEEQNDEILIVTFGEEISIELK